MKTEIPTSKVATLLFELGKIQVLHVCLETEAVGYLPYKEIYWQNKYTLYTYGPFASLNEAMTHYVSMELDVQIDKNEPSAKNIIQIDFKTKKRLK